MVAQLERELDATRIELQSTIRDLEASNEELKASNEEATSMNEELQSTNEELETSKEELQSLNEELSTVNAELQERVEAQKKATNDLGNLLASSEIATLFLDRDLRIRFFTPAAQRLFHVIDRDLGRPLADFVPQIDDPTLLADAAKVLESLIAGRDRRQERRGRGSRISAGSRRIATTTASRASSSPSPTCRRSGSPSMRCRAAHGLEENIVDSVRDALLVLDAALGVVKASQSFYRMFNTESAAVEGRPIGEFAGGALNLPAHLGAARSHPPRAVRDG